MSKVFHDVIVAKHILCDRISSSSQDASRSIVINDPTYFATGTSTGFKLGTSTSQKIAFYGVTPVAQYSTTGTTTGFTAGAGTNVVDASTFTGNTGSTAYTIGDIVRALKLMGIIAA